LPRTKDSERRESVKGKGGRFRSKPKKRTAWWGNFHAREWRFDYGKKGSEKEAEVDK